MPDAMMCGWSEAEQLNYLLYSTHLFFNCYNILVMLEHALQNMEVVQPIH